MAKKDTRKKKKKKDDLTGPLAFYKRPEDLQAKVDEYFLRGAPVKGDKRLYTITGLSLYLGFSTRVI